MDSSGIRWNLFTQQGTLDPNQVNGRDSELTVKRRSGKKVKRASQREVEKNKDKEE